MAPRYQARIRPGVGGTPKGTIPWNKGISRNVTWGAAISAATKGKPKSLAWRTKMSVLNTGRRHSQESKDKMSAARAGKPSWCKGLRKATHPEAITFGNPGEQHWNWKGGISSGNIRFRQTSEYKAWRDAVFARDGYACRRCPKRGGYLQAHHVKSFADYPDLRLHIGNGETLCLACHRVETKEQRRNGHSIQESN